MPRGYEEGSKKDGKRIGYGDGRTTRVEESYAVSNIPAAQSLYQSQLRRRDRFLVGGDWRMTFQCLVQNPDVINV